MVSLFKLEKDPLSIDTVLFQGSWLGEWRQEYGSQPPLVLSTKCPCALNNLYRYLYRTGSPEFSLNPH